MVAHCLHRDYPLLNNVNLDQRLLGLHVGFIPFAQFISAVRLDMYASHASQALLLHGSEFPKIFTGIEQNFGEYEFSKSRRDQEIFVVAVIPKYPVTFGPMQIRKNPSLTVLYIGLADNMLHVMEIDTYMQLSDGFGYETVLENVHLVAAGNRISKETRLVTSPIHKDSAYCPGVNLNIAFMTLEDTIEDAVLISESAAEKMATTEMHEVTIVVRADQYPLNLWGNADDVRFMLDIGEIVPESGIFCAFRTVDKETLLSDTQVVGVDDLQLLHDNITMMPAGSRILDVTVNATRTAKAPKALFLQAEKYVNAANLYWLEIVKVYDQERKNGRIMSKAVNTLVSGAIQRLSASDIKVGIPNIPKRQKTSKLIGKNGRPIEFMEITVVYTTTRKCEDGFKLTGRDGCKGVICHIIPDADMPVDDHGFRADIVMDPNSNSKRMTVGPIYEQAINRVSEFVRRKLKATDPQTAAALLLDYYADINPNYAELIRRVKPTEQAMSEHVRDCIDNGIHLLIPTGLNTINMSLISMLKQKWDVPISPVTFTQRDLDGNIIGTFRTKNDVCIGSKYIYLLCKIPEPSSPGVAHINQYNTPMKAPSVDRYRYPIKRNPIRTGEDENRIVSMDLEDAYEHMRLMCIQGGSPEGVRRLIDEILNAEYPTRIGRVPISTTELIRSNSIVQVFNHMFATMGLGTSTKGAHPLLDDILNGKY